MANTLASSEGLVVQGVARSRLALNASDAYKNQD